MKYVFYITNHGFGHASRNVPIIQELLRRDVAASIFVKTDKIRADFLRRNLTQYADKICYYEDVNENGLILKKGEMIPDIVEMEHVVREDLTKWNGYVDREVQFLTEHRIDIVIADVVAWAIKAAHQCGIKSVLIGNFDWAQMYKAYYDRDIWGPYYDCYRMANKAIWYELHADELHGHCENYVSVSMVSRAINEAEVDKIRQEYKQPMIFVSLGASAELDEPIDVSELPYDFAVTRGITLLGDNVHALPEDMVNTPDYIAASDYVVAKGGWSTVAEIMLQRKKCALLLRGENPEDDNNKRILESRRHCIAFNGGELRDMKEVIERLKNLKPDDYDMYVDDVERICDIINQVVLNSN